MRHEIIFRSRTGLWVGAAPSKTNQTLIHHIYKTVAKCCGILIGLASAKNVLPLNVLPRLIDALVFSHMRYCVEVYGNASNCHLRKIQKVFNFAARNHLG